MLRKWRPDLQCVDIRGNIEARLKLLDDGHLDGVVIAEAALIRLGLTHRTRMKLSGPAAYLQGQLAIVAREEDEEMADLFASVDVRKVLNLGTEPKEGTVHFPVLKLTPRPIPAHILDDFAEFTHVIFTSKNGVRFFSCDLRDKTVIALGQKTAEALVSRGTEPAYVASEESQEGVVDLLRPMDLDNAYILYPRSSLARGYLESFFQERRIRYQAVDLYDTETNKIMPSFDLHEFKEIIFSSPSTVKAFVEIFGHLPQDKKLTAIGPITQEAMRDY
jgi:hydroxymethylbilane synthase